MALAQTYNRVILNINAIHTIGMTTEDSPSGRMKASAHTSGVENTRKSAALEDLRREDRCPGEIREPGASLLSSRQPNTLPTYLIR